jgi:GH24 family phage-related lysozyme (muramidase)
MKARSSGIKETFDPLNIAKALTGGSNLAPAMLGRLLGRSSSDIKYFSGKKDYTPRRESSYFNNYTPPTMSSGGSRKATRVLEKMLSFMEKSRTDDMQEQDTLDSFNELNEKMREDRHKEVMDVFIEATKTKRKAEKDMAREAKKREREAKKKEAEPKKETPKPEASKPEAPKPQTKTETPSTAKPVETVPPAPTATPSSPVTSPKPPIVKPAVTEAAKSAAKVVGGVTAAVGATEVIARIKKKEGFEAKAYHDPKRDKDGKIIEDRYSVGYGHQITPDEVKQGFIKSGDTNIPVMGKLGKDTVITEKDASVLVNQDFQKYDRSARKITNFDKIGPDAQMAFLDMTYNMGEGWFSPQKWPKLHQALTNLDMEAAADSITNSLYYKQTGKRADDNVQLIRKSSANKAINANETKAPGSVINNLSSENADMKKDMSQGSAGGSPVIIQNNNTTQAKTNIHRAAPKEELNPTMR